MLGLRQKFPVSTPVDLRATLQKEFPAITKRIKPGARIAVGVGSRGIANLQAIVAGVLDLLKAAGAQPFVVPAMGSHGGATPEGQRELLAEYGVTEKQLQVPIDASMEAERIGLTPDGVEVFFSTPALRADGVVVVNRVKPHTDFHSDTLGSGLQKMLVIGLGKRVGAANFHRSASRFGYEQVIRTSARVALQAAPVLGGVAIVENQLHDTARLAVVLPEDLERRETELYGEAKRLMPQLPFADIDLLIVDRIGKNISGSGMDPNVIGRSLHGYSALLSDRSTHPVIAPSLFRKRSFVVGLIIVAGFFAAQNGFLLAFNLLLQLGLHWSPLDSGLALIPWALGSAVGVGLAGAVLVAKLGRATLQLGLGCAAAGLIALCWTIVSWHDDLTAMTLTPALLAIGFGTGLVGVPIFEYVLGDSTTAEVGTGSGMLNAVQQFASAIGFAALGTVFFAKANHGTYDEAGVLVSALAAALFLITLLLVGLLPKQPRSN